MTGRLLTLRSAADFSAYLMTAMAARLRQMRTHSRSRQRWRDASIASAVCLRIGWPEACVARCPDVLLPPPGVPCPRVGELGRELDGAVAPTKLLCRLPQRLPFPPPAKDVRRLSLMLGVPCSSPPLPPTKLACWRGTGSAMPL